MSVGTTGVSFSHADDGDRMFDEPLVNGSIPGPRSAELLARQDARESSARTYPRRLQIAIGQAQGSYVEDLDGNVFIDFLNGAGSLPLGHSHPELLEAIQEQLMKFQHGLDFPTEVRDEYISMHMSMLPAEMQGRTKIGFCGPTGANAIEAALKLCKTATGRSDVISFHGGYHGGSHGAMAVSGLVGQKAPVGGQMPGVHFFPYPYELRSALKSDDSASLGTRCAEYLGASLRDPLGGVPLPAAVLVEVVQGEGGVIPASTDFIRGIREVTRELDIPLIVDEVQSGCGRTGSWFSFEQHGIIPDVIVASKAAGGLGMPVALIMYDERLDKWEAGAHTGTFRGNQVAFAAGLKFMEILNRDALLDHVRETGAYALASLQELADRHAIVAEARGSGLMLGFELVDPLTGDPNGDAAHRVQRLALERGLIVELGGRDDAVVRLLPPLNVSRRTLDQALAILAEAVALTDSAWVLD
jgi:diaminobutyrate-2-oxoglutarate transaminase